MATDDLQAVLMFVRDGIFSAVFLWLLVREQISHSDTREAYRQDLRDIAISKTLLKKQGDDVD